MGKCPRGQQCLDWLLDCRPVLLTCVCWFQTTMRPLKRLASIHGSVGCRSTLFTRSERAANFCLMSNRKGCSARRANDIKYCFSICFSRGKNSNNKIRCSGTFYMTQNGQGSILLCRSLLCFRFCSKKVGVSAYVPHSSFRTHVWMLSSCVLVRKLAVHFRV